MNGEPMNNKRNKVFLILSIIMTLIIWINSFLPADLSAAQSGWVVGLVQSILNVVNIDIGVDTLSLWIRKLAHFTEFMILGILWFFTIHGHQNLMKKSILYVMMIAVSTAIIDETIQLFSEGRAFAVLDIGIDTLGVIFGLFLCFIFIKLFHKKENQ
jgi:VanZ family protein